MATDGKPTDGDGRRSDRPAKVQWNQVNYPIERPNQRRGLPIPRAQVEKLKREFLVELCYSEHAGSISSAAAAIGVVSQTIDLWRNDDPIFRDHIENIRSMIRGRAEQRLYQLAVVDGEVAALKEYLAANTDNYGRQKIDQTIKDGRGPGEDWVETLKALVRGDDPDDPDSWGSDEGGSDEGDETEETGDEPGESETMGDLLP